MWCKAGREAVEEPVNVALLTKRFRKARAMRVTGCDWPEQCSHLLLPSPSSEHNVFGFEGVDHGPILRVCSYTTNI